VERDDLDILVIPPAIGMFVFDAQVFQGPPDGNCFGWLNRRIRSVERVARQKVSQIPPSRCRDCVLLFVRGSGDRRHHDVQAHRWVRKAAKPVPLVKPRRVLVLGVHDDGHGTDVSTCLLAAVQSIPKEPTAEPLALMSTRNGKPSHERSWNAGLTAEPLGHLLRNRIEKHSGRTKGVVARDFNRLGRVDEDVRDRRAPFHLFPRLLLQIRIEGFDAAVEALAVVSRVETFDDEF
jgi:hypothetical protein